MESFVAEGYFPRQMERNICVDRAACAGRITAQSITTGPQRLRYTASR
jgi:hypothetical protein